MLRSKVLLSTLLLLSASAQAADLSLQGYLQQVKEKNQAYQAAAAQARGSTGLTREADLIYSPKLFLDARTGYDEKQQRQSGFVYDEVDLNNYSLGISQKTSFGLEGKVSYLLSDSKIIGIDTGSGNKQDARFADGTLQLELSLPLWGNGFGRTTRANEEVTRQQALANEQSALSQSATILSNAEIVYWRLASAIEQLKVEEQTLKAARNIENYVVGKKRKDLGEAADVLQANALVESYSLQVQRAQAEFRSAQREFNLYLNADAAAAIPNLESLNYASLGTIALPSKRPGDRPDVKASAAQAKLAQASSVLATERNKPTFDLYGAYNSYGQEDEASKALRESGKFERDGAYVGVTFSVPLNISALNDAKNGAKQSALAAESNLKYLQYAQEQQWVDLTQKFEDAKQTLRLATSLEKAQKEKLENERTRLRQGRTTTYQVLLFEQEYNSAQAAKVQAAARILNLQSESKLYQPNSEGGI